jgi:predicted MFS family arabinose efflux permease
VTGTGPAFASVAVLASVLGVWAWRTPAFTPQHPQPFNRLVGALRDRGVVASIWFVLVPALLFGALNVLGPLRLDVLGLSALAIGATWLVAASFEAALAPVIGRFSDRRGRLAPLRVGLIGSAAATAALPWIGRGWLLAVAIVFAACAFGSFWTPSMSMLADRAEAIGLDYAYGFALINLAWAPGAAAGSALGGAAARATSDAAVYLTLSALCVFTLLTLTPRLRATPA